MRTMLKLLIPVFFFLISSSLQAQLVSGPMPGHIELRTAKIWVEVKPGTQVDLWYWKKGARDTQKSLSKSVPASDWFGPVTFDLVGLEFNTTYEYNVVINPKSKKSPETASGEFTTQDLWQYRKPVADFSFLAGSCSYTNEPYFDRPGSPYGKDSSIFETMSKEKASFMLWLGDNWYTREADFFSEWGMWYRASHDRSSRVLQGFLKSMPHYAIWDDHDFGPNNADQSFVLKETSRKVFMNYWANPSYGEDNKGIYSKVSYNDCDFFLMDDRYWRSADDMESYILSQPNTEKKMWGAIQMEWLKNSLIQSRAPFKFIVTGSQVLNTASPFDCMQHYPVEFSELMGFLSAEKIGGVIFLTGDRHHSEVVKYERAGEYSLYDVTSSPLTSSPAKVIAKEQNYPARVPGTLVEAQNYSRFTITGKAGERQLSLQFLGLKGEKLGEWTINEKDLRVQR
jgi:alkaline phosphatase D